MNGVLAGAVLKHQRLVAGRLVAGRDHVRLRAGPPHTHHLIAREADTSRFFNRGRIHHTPAPEQYVVGMVLPDDRIAVYHDLLGRNADDAGLTFWLGSLAAGTPRGAVASAFAISEEHAAAIIAGDYRAYLGRDPDAAGMQFWLRSFQSGTANRDIVAALLSSAEYYGSPRRGQGNSAAWVRSIYQDALHRPAGDTEVGFWANVMR